MPNDAKLGLLVGVVGVIVVALMSVGKPTNTGTPTSAVSTGVQSSIPAAAPPIPEAASPPERQPSRPVARPTELANTPVPRLRKEPEGTPTSRSRNDDIDE